MATFKASARGSKPKQGSARMLAQGKKPSQLWYTPEQYALVQGAAKIDGRPMTQFAKRAALAAAKKLLGRGGEAVPDGK